MIRKKKRGRTPAYRIIALILIQLISFCGSRNASASGVKDLIGLLGGEQAIRVEMKVTFEKLPQFDKHRTEQLNQIMKHITFYGMLDTYETDISASLDGNELFSVSRTEINGTERNILKAENDRFYIIPEGESTESDHQDSISDLLSVFESVSGNEKIYKSMECFAAFIEKLPEYFPEQSGTGKTMQKYKDYGTAVTKVTVRISAEELKSCITAHLAGFPDDCFPDPTGFMFTGRQDFELLMTEEGKALKIRYGGTAGLSESDMRTVRLEWKTVRSDAVDRDEITLRTPDSTGTRRNNLILEHFRRIQDDGKEIFFWKTETDKLENGIRTRSFFQADAEAENGIITGNISETIVEKGYTYGNEISFSSTEDSAGQYSGTLEIISKKDKIESGKLKATFGFSTENGIQAADMLSEPESVSEKEYAEIRRIMISRILKEIIKLPPQNLDFLTEGIPEEAIAQILPKYEPIKEPAQ